LAETTIAQGAPWARVIPVDNTDALFGTSSNPFFTQAVASTAVIGHVIVDSGTITETNSAAILADTADIENNTSALPTALGQTTMSASLPIAIASDQPPLRSSTGTKSNVAGSASSVTILASNTSRKWAVFYNDSTQIWYLDVTGGTSSTTSYTVQVPSQGYFELLGSPVYTGAVTGIQSSANGNMRVTEFT
jgi:hypothetical protein